MPRPTDSYTHAQFERIESANSGETVRCLHCGRWRGSSKVLNRKKAHLQACPQYTEWRAAGNGQDLAPPNPYKATSRRGIDESTASVNLSSSSSKGSNSAPLTPRQRSNLNITRYFDEFFDDSLGQKCARVRCKACGFIRAKNATRQAEHLTQCKEFLATLQAAISLEINQSKTDQPRDSPPVQDGATKSGPTRELEQMAPTPPRAYPTVSPSLTKHLLTCAGQTLLQSTQNSFLSHAACGTLTEKALSQWLAQIGYVSRALVPLIGALIGKIRIPEAVDLQRDPTCRCLDLLSSAVTNMKRELEFIEATKCKYALHVDADEPRPPTKGFIDLLNSASSPSVSLLEGMVVLWAIEMLFYHSFSYAGDLVSETLQSPQQTPYAVPSYLSVSQAAVNGNSNPRPENISIHIRALHEAFIENWKSENFGRFVDACKVIVDELALAQTTSNGKTEMLACERVFKQAVWLWGQMFPENQQPPGAQNHQVGINGDEDDTHSTNLSSSLPIPGSGTPSRIFGLVQNGPEST